MVLSGEDVAGAPPDGGAKGGESFNEDGGLDSDMERTSDSGSLEGLGGSKLSSTCHETRHFYLSELDLKPPKVCL